MMMWWWTLTAKHWNCPDQIMQQRINNILFRDSLLRTRILYAPAVEFRCAQFYSNVARGDQSAGFKPNARCVPCRQNHTYAYAYIYMHVVHSTHVRLILYGYARTSCVRARASVKFMGSWLLPFNHERAYNQLLLRVAWNSCSFWCVQGVST